MTPKKIVGFFFAKLSPFHQHRSNGTFQSLKMYLVAEGTLFVAKGLAFRVTAPNARHRYQPVIGLDRLF